MNAKCNIFPWLLILTLVIAGCTSPTPTPPPPTATFTSTPQPTPTFTTIPTNTPTVTDTPEPTPTPTNTATLAPATPTPPSVPFVCNDPLGCVDIAPDGPVHIAYMLTISGPTAFLGEDSLGAIEIAIEDRGGRMLGHDILLTGEDSGCSAAGGISAASSVAADPTILGVIGTNCSSAMTAAMGMISQSGLVILSPSNTAPAMTFPYQTYQPGYFRVSHTDIFQGIVAAEFAFNQLGLRTAATLHDGSPYADQLQTMFAEHFRALGGTITFQGEVMVYQIDMRPTLIAAAEGFPDILYLPIFEPEGPRIVVQSAEIPGLESTVLMGADGLMVDSFPENAGSNAVGMYLSGPYISGPRYDELLAKWETKFGSMPPSGFHAFAYDATNILLDAIQAVAVLDADGTLHISRQALRDWISSLTGYPGITGLLDCRENDFGTLGKSMGDCATGESIGIFQITEEEVFAGNWPPPVVYTP